ncbi:MAG: hypothetical protein ACI9GM_001132 [Salibacteraceae bacterium]|jgi:hypothetical protein
MKNLFSNQTPNNRKNNWAGLFTAISLLFFTTNLTAQIKVWSNNHVTTGYSTAAPNEQFNVNGDFYLHPTNTQSGGFYFENYYNNDYGNAASYFNEPILRPQFGMSMWLGNSGSQLYRVYTRRLYHSDGIYTFSDRRLKTNIVEWNESALAKLMRLNAYRYDMDPTKLEGIPEGKKDQVLAESKNKIGFMAQEIQVEFPEVVKTASENGYLAVDYTMMIPVLLEAIKEQQALILELQAKVIALETK